MWTTSLVKSRPEIVENRQRVSFGVPSGRERRGQGRGWEPHVDGRGAPLRLLAGVTAVVALSVGSAAPVSAAGPTVSVEAYVQAVCGSFVSVAARIEPLGTAFQQAVANFKTDPTQVNAVALRDTFLAVLEEGRLDGVIEAGELLVSQRSSVASGSRKAVVRHTRDADRRMRPLIGARKTWESRACKGSCATSTACRRVSRRRAGHAQGNGA